MLGQIATALYVDGHISRSVNDQCSRLDRRENVAMSIWLFIRMYAVMATGGAPSRSRRPNQRWNAGSLARDGTKNDTATPLPPAWPHQPRNRANASSVGNHEEKRANAPQRMSAEHRFG